MKVLICGSRDYKNIECIKSWLRKLKADGYNILIEGECRGADIIARKEAEKMGFEILSRTKGVKGFPAQWNKYGRAAGPIRNHEMIIEGKPDLVVAFHNDIENSKGTADMLKQAKYFKIKTILVSNQVCIFYNE